MADLDPIIQQILLEGDDEILHALEKIGKDGSEHIKELAEACAKGATPMEALGGALGIIEAAIATATVAILHFVESQDAAVQKTAFLAEAMGTTTGALQGIEAGFAQAGVSAQTFERFANRLTLTIAQQWPQITESIRTSATAQDEAQNRVVAATLRVREAQNAVAIGAEQDASKIANANLRVQQTFTKLAFAVQDAAAAEAHANNTIASSNQSLEAAEQRLKTLQGQPPSDAEKKALELKQAQLAVDQARQASTDALLAKQKQQAEAAEKQAAVEQAAADAQIARESTLAQLETSKLQRENALREAKDAQASAEERSSHQQLSNITAITGALDGIIAKNKEQARSVDITQVSVVNLERAIINAASAGKGEPSGLDTLHKLSEVLHNDTEGLISQSQRLALVQRLSATSLHNSGVATSELLHVLEESPEVLQNFEKSAEAAFSNTALGVQNVKDFKGALEAFQLELSLTQQNLAALASPALTEFLKVLKESLSSSTGLLHQFVEGIKFIGSAVAAVVQGVQNLAGWIDKAFSLQPGTAMKVLLIGLVTVVAAFAGWWAAIPAAVILIITYLGTMKTTAEELGGKVKEMWEKFTNTPTIKFLERVLELLGLIKKHTEGGVAPVFAKTNEEGAALVRNAGPDALPGGTSTVVPGLTLAGGGEVHGPGTTTSDSVFARLSRGEFVVKAAAVQAYGSQLFHQLNSMTFPGFAQGGMVAAPVRLSGGGSNPATSTLNLTIGDRTFSGLRGPKDVVDDLASFAIGRQTSSAGRNPSWFGK